MEQRSSSSPTRADVTAGRFLSDLRALRTQAGYDHGQLAARAHYPRDVIAAAEAGPYLPALPVLAAYVRGCGGTGDEILDWEDRWRMATGSKAHPLLSARVAGLSGANRPLSPENPDPTAVRSALRRFGDRMSQPGPAPSSSSSSSSSDTSSAAPTPAAPAPAGPVSATPVSAAPPTPVDPGTPVAPPTPVDPGTPVDPEPTPKAAPAATSDASDPAGHKDIISHDDLASPRSPQVPEPPQPVGGGMSARPITITIAAIVAVLVIVLIVLLIL